MLFHTGSAEEFSQLISHSNRDLSGLDNLCVIIPLGDIVDSVTAELDEWVDMLLPIFVKQIIFIKVDLVLCWPVELFLANSSFDSVHSKSFLSPTTTKLVTLL